MGLDVLVYRLVIPPAEALKSRRAWRKYSEEVPADLIGLSDDEAAVLKGSQYRIPNTLAPGKFDVCIRGPEIGYLAKGANSKFYDDGKWGGIVVQKAALLDDWRKYFDSSEKFKKNILDCFVEGETIVCYW